MEVMVLVAVDDAPERQVVLGGVRTVATHDLKLHHAGAKETEVLEKVAVDVLEFVQTFLVDGVVHGEVVEQQNHLHALLEVVHLLVVAHHAGENHCDAEIIVGFHIVVVEYRQAVDDGDEFRHVLRRDNHVERFVLVAVNHGVGVDVLVVVAVEEHQLTECLGDVENFTFQLAYEGGVDVSTIEFSGSHLHDVIGLESDVLRYAVDGDGLSFKTHSRISLHIGGFHAYGALDGLIVIHFHQSLVDFLAHGEFQGPVFMFLYHLGIKQHRMPVVVDKALDVGLGVIANDAVFGLPAFGTLNVDEALTHVFVVHDAAIEFVVVPHVLMGHHDFHLCTHPGHLFFTVTLGRGVVGTEQTQFYVVP